MYVSVVVTLSFILIMLRPLYFPPIFPIITKSFTQRYQTNRMSVRDIVQAYSSSVRRVDNDYYYFHVGFLFCS